MHLNEVEIAKYVGSKLDDQARKRIESHLSDCPSCVEQVAALARLAEEMPITGQADLPTDIRRQVEEMVRVEVGGRKVKPRSLWTPMRYAIAATLLVAVGVTYFSMGDRSQPEQFRSADESAVSFGLEPADGAALSRQDLDFEWQPVPAAISYRITLYDLAGETLWSTTSAENSIGIPDTIALQSGATYLWRVDAIFPDDTRLRSPLNAFTFSP